MEQGNQGGDDTSLQAFNRCVLHLGRLARERGAAEFIADGLQAFASTGALRLGVVGRDVHLGRQCTAAKLDARTHQPA